jgi:hypothetical protein
MSYAQISGKLIDSDGIPWRQATWTAVPVSPSSKPVFPDGTPVPAVSGTLDDNGTFSGQVPITINIRPPGTTLTFTIATLTSAPPLTITKVQVLADPVDLGALLSPRISAPRIPAASIVYAYDAKEVTNPKHGNGYVNTISNRSFIYMQNSWQPIGTSIDPLRVAYVDEVNTFTQPQIFDSQSPDVRFYREPGGPADQNNWRFAFYSDHASFETLTDAGAIGANIFYAIRAGATPTLFCVTRPMLVNNGLEIQGVVTPQGNQGGLALSQSNDVAYIDSVGQGGPRGTLKLRVAAGNDTAMLEGLTIDGSGTVNVTNRLTLYNSSTGGNTIISTGNTESFFDSYGVNGSNYGQFHFRSYEQTGTSHYDVLLLHPSQTELTSPLNIAGTLHVTGAITSDVGKTFQITHPLDASRDLIHGCLEGPEFGVYYRGEAKTDSRGLATIELPEYFEALTRADGRTVQLTPIDEDEDYSGDFPSLASSRVKGGTFTVRANRAGLAFFWEVKAVRADIEELAVEVAKVNQAEPEPNK